MGEKQAPSRDGKEQQIPGGRDAPAGNAQTRFQPQLPLGELKDRRPKTKSGKTW